MTMTDQITRRTATQALVGTGIALFSANAPSVYQASATESPMLGSPQSLFDSQFGAGTPTDNGLVQYAADIDTNLTYYVRFADDVAEFVEADFSQYPNGGLAEEDSEPGKSRFLPADAVVTGLVNAGELSLSRSKYTLTSMSSESLAGATGRSGNLVLVFEKQSIAGDQGMSMIVPRVSSAMETQDELVFTPTDIAAKLGTDLTSWKQVYGEGVVGQTSLHFELPGLGLMLVGNQPDGIVDEVDLTCDPPVPAGDVVQLISDILPLNSELLQTHWLSPTPSGDQGLRIQFWQAPEMQTPLALLVYVQNGEGSGTVSRVIMSKKTSEGAELESAATDATEPTSSGQTQGFAARQYLDPGVTDSSSATHMLNLIFQSFPDEASASEFVQSKASGGLDEIGVSPVQLTGIGDEAAGTSSDDNGLMMGVASYGVVMCRVGVNAYGAVYMDMSGGPVDDLPTTLVTTMLETPLSNEPVQFSADGRSVGGGFDLFPVEGDPILNGLVPFFDTEDPNSNEF